MNKQKLLIVDDDRAVCDALRKLLEAEGYEVLTAYDATDAITHFRAHAIDLVVLDVNLGADNGWSVFQTMVAINPFVPTIVITAEWGQRERAIAAGAEALIEKPIDVPSFLELIGLLLSESAEHRLQRICDKDDYCHYVAKDGSTFLRLLQERRSAPMRLSSQIKTTLPGGQFARFKDRPRSHTSVVGDPTSSAAPGNWFRKRSAHQKQ